MKTRLEGDASVTALALQRDGRIVAGGGGTLVRYRPNGSLDRPFGAAGRVTTRVSGGGIVSGAITIRADGKIVAGGSAPAPMGGTLPTNRTGFLVARLDRRGRLDRGFGRNGLARTGFREAPQASISALRLEQGGRVLAAGPAPDERVAMASYTADGRLDPTFGNAGTLVVDFVRGGRVETVAIGPDGSMIAAGSKDGDFVLVRFKPDGSRELGFGSNGLVTIDFGADDYAYAAAITRDRKVVVFGSRIECIGDPEDPECDYRSVGARLRPDGSPDVRFGRQGKINLASLSGAAVPHALAIAPSGLIAVAGGVSRLGKTDVINYLFLAVYRNNGSLDRRLKSPVAPAGVAVTDFTERGWSRSGNANAVAWDRNGKIVAAGDAAGQFALARYRLLPR